MDLFRGINSVQMQKKKIRRRKEGLVVKSQYMVHMIEEDFTSVSEVSRKVALIGRFFKVFKSKVVV